MHNGANGRTAIPSWRKALDEARRLLIRGARGLLAPQADRCIACGALAGGAGGDLPVCRSCYAAIPWIAPKDIRCAVCGRYESCPDCPRRTDASFVLNRSAVRYTETMKEWLGRFKYRGDERMHKLMAGMLRGTLDRLLAEQGLDRRRQPLYLTYVPLSDSRLAERGFNQTQRVAAALGQAVRIPVLPALDRMRHTGKQSHKSRAERLQDLRGAFAPREELFQQIGEGSAVIVLIDDVYTTGSTLEECARTIRGAVDARIYGLTWAR